MALAATVVGLCVLAVALMAWWTQHHVPAIDSAVADFFAGRRRRWSFRLAGVAARLGSVEVVIPAGAVAALLLVRARRSIEPAAMLVAAYLLAALPAGFLKRYLERPEPADALGELGRSFPSGHATQAAAVAAMIAVCILATSRSSLTRRLTIAVAAAVPAMVGLAMLVRSAHWLTDVVAGYALAAAAVVTVVTARRAVATFTARRMVTER